jgi:hypothetical protein
MKRGALCCAAALSAAGFSSNIVLAADSPAVGVNEKALGRSYADWNVEWARFEWAPGGKDSPLLHPEGCRHKLVGRMFMLPGPAKSGLTIACSIPAGASVFVPTASQIITPSKGETPNRTTLSQRARIVFKQAKVLDVTLDGQKIAVRQFKSTTPMFSIKAAKGSPFGYAGTWSAVQAGYNFILRPLPSGRHTLKMHVKIAQGGKTLYEARTTFKLKVA